jgi:ABC-2 type transport system ATP-binding protein
MFDPVALEARGIRKRFGDREALRGVDMNATTGEVHGLLGRNGAGKTTLLRVLLGLVRRDAGDVRLLGCEFDDTTAALPEGVAGFVETPAFYPYLSGRQNLALLGRLDGLRGRQLNIAIGAALEQSGLAAHAMQAVGAYSAGMRQRLGMASALLRRPRLLLLDEPTSALDSAAARDVRALVRRLAQDGAAVLFSSHDMEEVEALCSRISVIDAGRVIFSGTVDDLRGVAPQTVHHLHTSDDEAAVELASRRPRVRVTRTDDGIHVVADEAAMDSYVITLGCAGAAVRLLERRTRSLESLFLEITAGTDATVVTERPFDHESDSTVSLLAS